MKCTRSYICSQHTAHETDGNNAEFTNPKVSWSHGNSRDSKVMSCIRAPNTVAHGSSDHPRLSAPTATAGSNEEKGSRV